MNKPNNEWSTEPPDQPGWYWYAIPDSFPRLWGFGVVQFVWIKKELCWVEGYDDYGVAADHPATHWLGPIPKPEAPKSA